MSITETTTSDTSVHTGDIWDEQGNLVPLHPVPAVDREADVAAIIVTRNRADLADALVSQLEKMGGQLSMDIYVIEMGSDQDKLSRACSLRYEDDDFRGKCYGHNVGLRLARSQCKYRYYWILMNDLVFEDGQDAIGELVRIADANARIAVLSPTEPQGVCPWGKPMPDGDLHVVPQCDYLALLVRAASIDRVGFLNPEFRYCWGAIHELAYKLYAAGWQLAYCDKVTMKHLGGTTYGKAKGTVSREEYRRKASEFAARYFVEHYGSKWDEDFTKVLSPELNWYHFSRARRNWEAVDNGKQRAGPELARRVLRSAKWFSKRVFTSVRNHSSKADLRRQIDALHPWYYEVNIGGITVAPGIGSRQTPNELRGRVAYRTRLLVDEVGKRYDVAGKRLLDIASNCGYWAARYAELGAKSLVAVEGRAAYVAQGRLYWGNNQFVREEEFEFVHGNVMDTRVWDAVEVKGPFEFSLCCGILYHIPDYQTLLRHIARVTTEAVLIDTRVADREEVVEEPGGYCFDAIVETGRKKVPNLARLVRVMTELGFKTERLTIAERVPEGLKGPDDYEQGNRVALLAIRSGEGGA